MSPSFLGVFRNAKYAQMVSVQLQEHVVAISVISGTIQLDNAIPFARRIVNMATVWHQINANVSKDSNKMPRQKPSDAFQFARIVKTVNVQLLKSAPAMQDSFGTISQLNAFQCQSVMQDVFRMILAAFQTIASFLTNSFQTRTKVIQVSSKDVRTV